MWILLLVNCCAWKAGVGDVSDMELQMEAERIVVETFVRQQQTDSINQPDILVVNSDIAGSRTSSSKKSKKKSMKQRCHTSVAVAAQYCPIFINIHSIPQRRGFNLST